MTLWYSRHNLWDIYSADCSWPSCTTWWDGKFTVSEEFRCSICNRWSWRTYQRKQCISARQWLCRNSGQLRFQYWGMSLYPGNVVCHCFLFFWLGHRELLGCSCILDVTIWAISFGLGSVGCIWWCRSTPNSWGRRYSRWSSIFSNRATIQTILITPSKLLPKVPADLE